MSVRIRFPWLLTGWLLPSRTESGSLQDIETEDKATLDSLTVVTREVRPTKAYAAL